MKQEEEVIIVRVKSEKDLKTITTLVYALQAISCVLGVTYIAAVVINYVKLGQARGTWLHSHFVWQIRTFWYSLLWGAIGILLTPIFIGFFVLALTVVWIIYRIVKGWVTLSENREMYGI